MRELLSNNSLFVGQLYEDKSLALRASDLISLQLTSNIEMIYICITEAVVFLGWLYHFDITSSFRLQGG